MAFIYDKYNTNNAFKFHREYAFVILARSTSQPAIRLGDVGAQFKHMRLLLKLGWMEIVTSYN